MAKTKLIQVDIDAREIGKNYPITLGILADIKLFMSQLLSAAKIKFERALPDYSEWNTQIKEWQDIWDMSISPVLNSDVYPISPGRLINEIRKALPENGIFLTDVGVHHNWAVQFWKAYASQTIMQSWGFATMGFATAGALGAKLAAPERPVVAFVGDGSFMMAPQIVATAVEYNIPVVWVIINNHAYGSIRDLQHGYFDKREIGTSFRKSTTGELYNPDFANLAKAFGAEGLKVERPEDLAMALEIAIKSNKPYVIDVIVDRDIPPIGTGSWQFVPFNAPKPNFIPKI